MLYREARLVDDATLTYAMSDETVDGYGDVISADGWDLTDFKRNPIALFNHKSDQIIGTWTNVRLEGKRLVGQLLLEEPGTSELGDKVRKWVSQKILRAVSVGFVPIDKEPLNKDADPFWGPFRYLKQKLKECSLCAVPANPNAVQLARSFGLSDRDRALVLGKPAWKDEREARPAHRKPADPLADARSKMKLSERITAGQAELNQLRDTLRVLVEKDNPTEEEQAQIDELNLRIADVVKSLERLQQTERALAVTAADPGTTRPDPKRPFAAPVKKVLPVDYFYRSIAASFVATARGIPIENARAAMYGDDEATTWFIRAVVNPAMTTVPGWAQELVGIAIAEFMDTLKPLSVFPTLRDKGVSFTFDRSGGIIKVPGRSPTPQLAGAWVGEGQPIPVRRLGLTSVSLGPKKLGVISDFTQEMADYSTPAIEGVIRQAMAEDTAIVIDTNLLDATAATAIRPAGLRAGVAGLPPSALPDHTQAMIADLKALIGAIIAVNGGRDLVVIMNPLQGMGLNFAQTASAGFLFPSEGEAGRRFNVTFVQSTTVPVGEVIAVDAADFSSASGAAPEYNVSNTATVHEEDTAPLPIVDAAGAAAKPVRSYWQTDSIGIRMRLPLNWAMRRTGMVAWMDAVIW